MAVLSAPLDSTIEALNFTDNANNNSNWQGAPPDPAGAAGPTHVLNATNSSIQWFTKSGVEHAQTSLFNFFGPLNPAPNNVQTATNPIPQVFDPKVAYDHYNNRFVVVALEALDTSVGDPVNSSRLLVAVSDDSDPNGTWHYQSFNTLQTINSVPMWFDFPGLAIDRDAIYVTGNMFEFGAGTSIGGSRLLIINKGAGSGGVYDGGFSTMNIYNPAGGLAATLGLNLQPAQVWGSTPQFGNTTNRVGTWLVAYNGGTGSVNDQLMVIRVDSPLNNPTFDVQSVNLGDIDNATNLGFSATTPVPFTLDAPQPGTTTLIDTGDRSTLNAVWRDNALWTVFQVIPLSGPDAGQTTVHWVKIGTNNPGSLVVADQGNIGADEIGGTIYTFMPSIAVDGAGNATVGFAASGAGLYGSAYYATRSATDPAGTFRIPQPLAVGQDTYVRTSGAGAGARNRWGDYSVTVLDPADGATFWVYNQYAIARATGAGTAVGRWGTRWGSLHIADLPTTGGGGEGTPTATVSGTKWSDLDNDGVRDTNEPGVAGFTFYVDINGNDLIDVGEPAAVSDSSGNFKITSQYFGTYAVREVLLPGWVQTFPGQATGYETAVTLVANQAVTGLSFGNKGDVYDFGDAPAIYPTKLDKNGARHAVRAGLHLGPPTVGAAPGTSPGVEPDVEADGQPDVNAQGDDLLGVDDEDGVIFSANSLIAGKTATISVIVSTGGLSAARLQGWIDFNGDGDWNDAGEQIVKDRTLGTGTWTVTFPVPATATRQATYARFRYGYEAGLGPTGPSIAGEVEDYQVQVLTDEPQANDDTYTVNQNSLKNVLTVLSNDFASSNGSLQIDSPSVGVPLTTTNGGIAEWSDNGTPTNTTDDVILYTPLNGYTGPDSFSYIISDGTGKTDSATVTLTVVSILNDPIAVDDSIAIPANTSGQVATTTLDVLANDVTGNTPPITISAVTQPAAGQGTVSITSAGSRLSYVPPSSTFAGDIQFTYTIRDQSSPTPKTSTAQVTLHVGNSTTDDLIQVRLQAFDLDGNAITVVNPGQEFEMRVFVKDLRTDDTVPPSPTDRLGVYAAYLDLLYDSKLVSLTAPTEFNGAPFDPTKPWTAGQSVNTSTPGMVDEVGAFQGDLPLFTQNFVRLFSQRMRAGANANGEAKFAADPADLLPLHEMLVFDPPTPPVDFTRVTYGTTSLFIGNPAAVLFRAVDDTLNASATTPTSLPVTLNDLLGTSTPVVIDSIPSRSAGFQGTLTISGQNIVYAPPSGGFPGSGTQQFTYRLRNAAGATQDATVTLQIGPNTAADDTVQIRLVATNSSGTPITSVNVGDTFQVRAIVKDLRADDGDGNPATDRRGVGAAYFDLLYNYRAASVVPSATNPLGFVINFGVNYPNGTSGDSQIPGVVDEVGAFQDSVNPLGPNDQLLCVVTFKADAAGTFTFQPDPANERPQHDVVLYEPTVSVSVGNLSLLGGSITVVGAGGEGEYTNPTNHLDVNNDGFVSAIDVLLIINDMNTNGSRPVGGGEGEGEGEGGTAHYYLDVNGDRYFSSIDALMIINYLNGAGGGEGEAATDATLDSPPFDDGADLVSPVSLEVIDDVTIETMATGALDDANTVNAAKTVDVVFDELDGADDGSGEFSDELPVIYYSTRRNDQSLTQTPRHRGDGVQEFLYRFALDVLRHFGRG